MTMNAPGPTTNIVILFDAGSPVPARTIKPKYPAPIRSKRPDWRDENAIPRPDRVELLRRVRETLATFRELREQMKAAGQMMLGP
jgi:hypothetical protein